MSPFESSVAVARLLRGELPGWSAAPAVAWLATEAGSINDPSVLLEQLAARLLEAGAPLWRLRVSMPTIHPEVRSMGYTWLRGEQVVPTRVGHEAMATQSFIGSPIAQVIATSQPFRRRLTDLEPGKDHAVLFELQEQGGTDYLAIPFRFWGAVRGATVFATDRDAGFEDDDIAKLAALAAFLAPLIEVAAMRNVSRALLATYLGPRTGERVLRGQIKRGDGELIEAAIWFSDLRDFTPLTESLPPKDLLAMLNAYFELVAAAVTARGGEILRFIGDAMLIVFPSASPIYIASVCDAAADAAVDAYAAVDALNHRRRRAGEPEIRFGVGLHVGEVIYGNVGAPDRLDFTVMGAAVNRAARIESLTKDLGCRALASAEFVRLAGREMRSLGRHALKGVKEPAEVFALEL